MHFIAVEFLQKLLEKNLRQSRLLFFIDFGKLEEGKTIGRGIMKNADDLSAGQIKR